MTEPRRYTLRTQRPAPTGIDYRAELNPQQYEAVTCPGGASLVIAGAGSGKTRTLTYRVAWLLEQGVPARRILLLTFTNKAAREMLDRVSTLVPETARGVWGGTFHSIGNRILRRHADQLGLTNGFSILDRDDQKQVIDAVVAESGFVTTDRRFPKSDVLADIFSLSINTVRPIGKILADRYRYFIPLADEVEKVGTLYEARKREINAVDFDDLLSKVLMLFKTNEEVAAIYQEQFQHILVDEYQDTNRMQSELVELLATKHQNVTVVGDDAQSIYSWRGANFANILEFPKRFPEAQVFRIETNYRSVPEILELANSSIVTNTRQFEKALRAVREAREVRPALIPLSTDEEQAEFVAQRVLELNEEGADLSEIAVLYRSHYHSLAVQLAFTRRGIPFDLTSGLRFFEQAHIKDVAAFLKFAVNPRDEIAFKRIVRLLPGVGPKAADTLWKQSHQALADGIDFSKLQDACKPPRKATASWNQLVHTLVEIAPQGKPIAPGSMIESVVEAVYDDYMQAKFTNYENRREDLATVSNYASGFESTEDFLAQLSLLTGVDVTAERALERDPEKVTLSSIHQAKGLEWDAVFVIWLTEGMFPSARSSEDLDSIEEERRLFYVSVTRAKNELYLTYPEMRLSGGYGDAIQRPSRFLAELPDGVFVPWDVSSAPDEFSDEDVPF